VFRVSNDEAFNKLTMCQLFAKKGYIRHLSRRDFEK